MIGVFLTTFILSSQPSECLMEHFTSSRELMRSRRDLYFMDSDRNDSRAVSLINDFLRLQWFARFEAHEIEIRAIPFRNLGIPLFCEEHVTMAEIPPYVARMHVSFLLNKKEIPEFSAFKKRIEALLRTRSWDELDEELLQRLNLLNSFPNYLCLERHLVESFLRTLRIYQKRVKAFADGTSPLFCELQFEKMTQLTERYLRFHLRGLGTSRRLDKSAVSLQNEGIPIFCQDVPPIPITID